METVYVRCDDVQGVGRALLARRPAGVRDVHPVFATIAVTWDPARIDRVDVERWIRAADPLPAATSRSVRVPVRYDGADLADIAAATGLDVGDVIARHSAPDYEVVTTGALPGQPFLAPNDEALRLPRRPSPRVLLRGPQHRDREPPDDRLPDRRARGLEHHRHLAAVVLRPAPCRSRSWWRPATACASSRPTAPIRRRSRRSSCCRRRAARCRRCAWTSRACSTSSSTAAGSARRTPAWRSPGRPTAARRCSRTRSPATPPGTPLVEMTMHGPQLTVLRPLVVGFAGLGGTLEVDGELAGWQTLRLEPGARLRVRGTNRGARSYLALAGGIEARSVPRQRVRRHPRADRAGAAGRRRARRRRRRDAARRATRRARRTAAIRPGRSACCPGRRPTPRRFAALCAGDVHGRRRRPDRRPPRRAARCPAARSCRSHRRSARCRSRPAASPIILLADRLRTAGYTKPALVHPDDLGRVAQLRAGDPVTFVAPRRAGAGLVPRAP